MFPHGKTFCYLLQIIIYHKFHPDYLIGATPIIFMFRLIKGTDLLPIHIVAWEVCVVKVARKWLKS